MTKQLDIKGYGKIMINPVNLKDQEFESVDPAGKQLTSKMVGGTRGKTVYTNSEGTEISSSQICKKFVIDSEEIIVPKLSQTKDIEQDNIDVLDDNSLIYRALERKFYSVVTDNQKLKDLILTERKSLQFPFTAGNGWKIWNAILTQWNGKIVMIGCRGDLTKELDKFADDTVDIEVEALPQNKNMKKLVKALIM